MITVKIKGATNGKIVNVNELGEIPVADLYFSRFYLGVAVSNNVAVNVVPPITSKRFLIKSIILSGDRSIGANGAIVDIFENSVGPTDGTITQQIIQEEIAKQTRMTTTPLNIIISPGNWVNVKADDVIVRCNISGYYVDA
jgi:hypothetical protein